MEFASATLDLSDDPFDGAERDGNNGRGEGMSAFFGPGTSSSGPTKAPALNLATQEV
jgi:hypothetical protein